MVFSMDQAHQTPSGSSCHLHPPYIYTLHPSKFSLASSAGIGPPEQLCSEVFMLWLWKCTSFQSSQGRKSIPCPIPSLWRECVRSWQSCRAFFPGLSLISPFPMACCCAPAPSSTTAASSCLCLEQMFRLCCRQTEHLGTGQGDTRDSPGREGAEGHRKPLCSISFSIWPEQLEKKAFNKMQASPRACTNFSQEFTQLWNFPSAYWDGKVLT